MAEGNQVNGVPPANSNNEGNTPGAPPGALNLEAWYGDGRTYDTGNNRRNEAAVMVREDLTGSTLWDRIEPGSILAQLATDGSLLYQIGYT